MSDADRLDAIEEALMRLQTEIEQLDDALRTQTRSHDELARRVEHLERRLARLEPDNGNDEEPRIDTNEHE